MEKEKTRTSSRRRCRFLSSPSLYVYTFSHWVFNGKAMLYCIPRGNRAMASSCLVAYANGLGFIVDAPGVEKKKLGFFIVEKIFKLDCAGPVLR